MRSKGGGTMATHASIRRLERRVATLERQVSGLRPSHAAEMERARTLLLAHLRVHPDVEPLAFAVRHDLSNEVVERVLEEFDKKNWTVPVDD